MPAQDPPFAFDWTISNGFGSAEIESVGGSAPLPSAIGTLRMSAWSLGEGAGLLDPGLDLNQQVSIKGTKITKQNILVIRAGVSSQTQVCHDGGGSYGESVGQYRLRLYCSQGDSCTVTYGAGQQQMGLSPIITEDRLRSILIGQKPPPPVERFLEGRGEDFTTSPGTSLAMNGIVNQIRHHPFTGAMEAVYLQGKVYEMLAVALAGLSDTPDGIKRVVGPDRKRAMMARDLIMADLTNPPSVESLAGQVGLSQRRLVEAFRDTFGCTVFELIVQQRLDLARDLLLNSDWPVKEISFQLGYSHVNNFNAAFTRRHGVPPARYRQSILSVHAPGGNKS